MITVCIDDTDMPGTRGTNKLALAIVAELSDRYRCHAITKHPHLRHADIPFTHGNNSCCIRLHPAAGVTAQRVTDDFRRLMLADFIEGSDPGLCVTDRPIGPAIQDFARRSREEILTMDEAYALAAEHGVHLEGLGGTRLGVIGALAGAGTAWAGGPGAYLYYEGTALDMGGRLTPGMLRAMGITDLVDDETGARVDLRPLWVPKKLRPSMRAGQPVVYVREAGDALEFVRRDK